MKLNEAQEKQLIEWYNKGDSYSVIAERLGTSKTSVFRFIQDLKDKGLIVLERRTNREVIDEQKKQVLELYNAGLYCSQIAKKLNLPASIVEVRILSLKRSGYIKEVHQPKTSKDIIDEQSKKIAIWYEQNMSRKEMADRLGVPISLIGNRIRALRKEGVITTYNKNSHKSSTDRIIQLEKETMKNGYEKESVGVLLRLYINQGLYKDAVTLLDHYTNNNNISDRDSELISKIKGKLQGRLLKRYTDKDER